MENLKLRITGKVLFSGIDRESKKNVVTLRVEPIVIEKLQEKMGDVSKYRHTPIKTNEETGESYIKASSQFEFDIFKLDRKGDLFESDYKIQEIGKDSIVRIAVQIKETKYGKDWSLVAYLQGIIVKEFVPYVKYNPFEDDLVEL